MAKCRNPMNGGKSRPVGGAEEAERTAPMEEDVPMNRYVCSLPVCPAPSRDRTERSALLEQLLEQVCRQNQILLDLLSAVNGLTGALLARDGRTGN